MLSLHRWLGRIGRNALLRLAAELAGRLATFALLLWAARRLGETGFGLYSYGLALAFVLSQIADLGLQLWTAREVAVGGRSAQPAVQTAFRLKLGLTAPAFLLLIGPTWGRPPAIRAAFLALGAATLAQTYLEFAAYVFRGQQRLAVEARLVAATRLLVAAGGAVVLWLGGGLMGLALSHLAVYGLAAVYAIYLLRREGWLLSGASRRLASAQLARLRYPQSARLRYPQSGGLRYIFRQAWPLGLAIFLSIAYTRLPLFLLEYRLDEVAVAYFSAAQRLVEPTQIAPMAMMAAVFPAYARALDRNRPSADRLAWQTSLLLTLAGAGLALLFGWGGVTIVSWLYGEAFRAAGPVLQYLGLSILPAYLNYSLTHYLIARGQQLFVTLFTALMLLAHGWLSWRWLPEMGPAGPAASVVVAEIILTAGCLLALRFGRPAESKHGLAGLTDWSRE
ncbi:MAG: oligosaccharide flippase family protein [Chloroflexota bacterium]